MARPLIERPDRHRHRRLARGARAQGAAALHHLRQRRRRKVDPDRAPALRHQADLRRPARGARSRQQGRHAGRARSISRCSSTASSAEREQGITIDVAYRFFATDKRKFIVADTPGHEQYTRNMVTGASTADLAVMLVDARKGVLTQTRRHSYLAQLLGIRHFVLAVNKMDLVDYDQAAFDAIVADYRAFAEQHRDRRLDRDPGLGPRRRQCHERSDRTPLVRGPTLLEHLDTVAARDARRTRRSRSACRCNG